MLNLITGGFVFTVVLALGVEGINDWRVLIISVKINWNLVDS